MKMRNKLGHFVKGHPQTNTGRTHFKKGKAPNEYSFKKGKAPNKYSFKKGHPKPKNAFKWGEGEKHPRWKGGKMTTKGYLYILEPNHPRANKMGYVKNSVIVMEKKIKRTVRKNEIVHHINNIHLDDRPENLYLCKNRAEHLNMHRYSFKYCSKW